MKHLLIYLTLRMHGWKPCTLHDGSQGWTKQATPITTYRGGTYYALAHINR